MPVSLLLDQISRSKARILIAGLATLLLTAVFLGATVQDRVHVFSVSQSSSNLPNKRYVANVRARVAWIDLFVVRSDAKLVSVSTSFHPDAGGEMRDALTQALAARLSDIRIGSSLAPVYFKVFLILLEYILPVAMGMIAVFLLLNRRARFLLSNVCEKCGYSLDGLPEPLCPECGCCVK